MILSNMHSFSEAGKRPLFVLIVGAKGDDGMSWCPDCNVADPIIQKGLQELGVCCRGHWVPQVVAKIVI